MARATMPLVDPQDLAGALGLLTRLPVAAGTRGARAAWAWPLAGLAVALIAALASAGWCWRSGWCPASPPRALAVMALLTGAMHEDGLGDSADGLFGGWTAARRLEIMKDSRIGTYGMLALLLVTLGRWSALTFLIATGHVLGPLIAAAVLSRAALPVAMLALPAARPDGLSRATGTPPRAGGGAGAGAGAARWRWSADRLGGLSPRRSAAGADGAGGGADRPGAGSAARPATCSAPAAAGRTGGAGRADCGADLSGCGTRPGRLTD